MTSRISLSIQKCLATLLAVFFVVLVAPLAAQAQAVLEIIDVNTKDATADNPVVRVYFSARNPDGSTLSGIKAENLTLQAKSVKLADEEEAAVDFHAVEYISKELKAFKAGDQPVAVVVVFPIARDYIEEFYGIRNNVATFIGQFRPEDWVGYVAYDSNARRPEIATGPNINALSEQIAALKETEVIEPNLYAALPAAINALKNIEGAKQKYLVVVSNAEGAVSGDDAAATKQIGRATAMMKEANVRPIIVGYTPDGPDELTWRKWLKQLSLAGGTYTEATALEELPSAMTRVYDQIFQAYILEVVLDLSDHEKYWLPSGKYNWTVTAKIGSQELKSSMEAGFDVGGRPPFPWLKWILIGLGALVGALLLILIIVKIARRKPAEETVAGPVATPVPQQPQEFRCEVCNKVIPEQLYNFRGEFCMSGAQPNCPYYQMPDHGRLTVTKGPLADITFFIKEEVTTIGKDIANSVALVDASVSKKHAAIKVDDANRYEIRDFGSTNGTYINGEKIQRMFLKDGDTITFGTVEMQFRLK